MRLFLSFLLLLPLTLRAATYYCGPTSTGSGTGADFNNRLALPDGASMGRHTYKIIEGSYGSRSFAAPTGGSARCIVQKVSAADSAVAGYSSTLHDGQAVFGSINIVTPFQTIDGVTRTETTRMEQPAGYGIRVTGVNADDTFGSPLSNADYSSFSYVQFGGDWSASDSPNCSWPEYACEFKYNQAGLTFTRCFLGCAGVNNGAIAKVHGCSDIVFDHCDFYMGWGKATIAAPNVGITRLTVKYCRFWNSTRRDTCPLAEGPGITCEIGSYSTGAGSEHHDNLVYGCIVYNFQEGGRNASIMWGDTSSTGGSAVNCKVFNNTFIGLTHSQLGAQILCFQGSGNEARNNLFYNCVDAGVNANSASHNVIASSNPFVDYNNRDFRLAVPTSAGYVLTAPYNTDPAGNPRGTDGTWDVGAYEYGGVEIPPDILTNNASWTNGVAGSYTITLEVAGTASYFGASGLPTGLSRSGAYITGTPSGYTVETPVNVTLFATNSSGEWDSQAVVFTIYPQQAIASITPNIGFGLIPTNTTADATFVISNAVPGTTLTGSVSNTAAPFSIVTSPATFSLSGTTTKTITMRYSPTTATTHSGTVAVSHSVGSNYVSLSGMAFPVTSGTNLFLTNALVLLPMVKSNTFVTVTNTQSGYPDSLLGFAIYGMNSAASVTGAWHGTFIATNVASGAAITVDASSSEHVENAASGETTPHAQGNLTDGYIIAPTAIWSGGDFTTTGATYDGAQMQLLTEHNLDYYGEYRVQIYGLAVGNKTSGTYNFAMTANGVLGHYNAGIVSLNNVLQTGSTGTAVDGVGTNSTAALTVSSADGELVFLAVVRGNVQGAPDSGETEHVDTQPEADGESQFPDTLWLGSQAGAASVSVGVDFTGSSTYCATAIPIKATTNYGQNSITVALNTFTNPWTWYVSATNWDTVIGTNQVILGTSNLVFVQVREPTTWMRELTFVADGEVGQDATDPVVTITSPTETTQSESTVNLAGTASDNVGVVSMTATNTTTGVGYTVDGLTTWTVENVVLQSGANTIVVYALDAESNEGTDSIEITYTPPASVVPSNVNDLRVNNLYTP